MLAERLEEREEVRDLLRPPSTRLRRVEELVLPRLLVLLPELLRPLRLREELPS